MSEKSKTLYQRIISEYKLSNKSEFEYNLFINKYGYSKIELEDLLDELKNCGYIEKWIIEAFTLNIEG